MNIKLPTGMLLRSLTRPLLLDQHAKALIEPRVNVPISQIPFSKITSHVISIEWRNSQKFIFQSTREEVPVYK